MIDGDELSIPEFVLPSGICVVEASTDDGQRGFSTFDVSTPAPSRSAQVILLR